MCLRDDFKVEVEVDVPNLQVGLEAGAAIIFVVSCGGVLEYVDEIEKDDEGERRNVSGQRNYGRLWDESIDRELSRLLTHSHHLGLLYVALTLYKRAFFIYVANQYNCNL